MSSPGARQRRRRQEYQAPRTRREVAIAAAAGAGIVVATALMVWMLRPGGIADRQPRSSWLISLALGAAVLACYMILRPKSKLKVDKTKALAGTLGAIVVVAVVAGIVWPQGLVRHTRKLAPFTTRPTTPTTQQPAPGVTTAPTGTTATSAAPVTTAPTSVP